MLEADRQQLDRVVALVTDVVGPTEPWAATRDPNLASLITQVLA
jgi:hypothetical protein